MGVLAAAVVGSANAHASVATRIRVLMASPRVDLDTHRVAVDSRFPSCNTTSRVSLGVRTRRALRLACL